MIVSNDKITGGSLFARRTAGVPLEAKAVAVDVTPVKTSSHKFAFAGLFLFTLLLYARPQELFPQLFDQLPLVKIVAIGTLLAYAGGKLLAGERFTIWPLEMKMLAVILAIGILLAPAAFRPQRSIDLLTDSFFKVIIIFVLIANLVHTRRRLHSIMRLVVICGVVIALVTIKNFLTGNFDISHLSKTGAAITVGNTLENTNELALTLDLLLPLAIVFAVTGKGLVRLAYLLCAALLAFGAVITFSRGGFLGLASMGGVLLWKLGRGKRVTMALAALVLAGVFAFSMPSGYSERLFTILHPENDKTNSAQERQMILARGFEVALHHPLIGIGIANFNEYSPNGKVAHNSYVEVAAELGWIGLVAYLTFLIAPFRSLKRIERDTYSANHSPGDPRHELYYLSVGLQAVMVAFMVCSAFSSSQYSWHPYYIVGYSISLQRIYAAHLASRPAEPGNRDEAGFGSGALWKLA